MGAGSYRLLAICGLIVALAGQVSSAQSPVSDELMTRLLAGPNEGTYSLRAEFNSLLAITIKGTRYAVSAEGQLREWQDAGEPRQAKVAVHKVTAPVLLRPFSKSLGTVIEELVRAQSDDPRASQSYDLVVLETPGPGRYILGGVRRDIVDEALARHRLTGERDDVTLRRAIAGTLFRSPTMRAWMVRPGPPYAFTARVDRDGLVHELTLLYDWGQVHSLIDYVRVGNRMVWKSIHLDTNGDVPGFGQVNGKLVVLFTNHCVNCQ